MVKLRDAIELTKNKAVKDNRYTELFGKSELESVHIKVLQFL